MQENVNAVNVISSAVSNFGSDNVQTCDGGIIKVSLQGLGNGDVQTLANLLQWSDVQVKRSGTGLLILLIPKPWSGSYSPELLAHIFQIELREGAIDADTKPDANDRVRSKEDDFKDAALPMMEYLSENHNPNTYATVDAKEAMLIEGLKTISRD